MLESQKLKALQETHKTEANKLTALIIEAEQEEKREALSHYVGKFYKKSVIRKRKGKTDELLEAFYFHIKQQSEDGQRLFVDTFTVERTQVVDKNIPSPKIFFSINSALAQDVKDLEEINEEEYNKQVQELFNEIVSGTPKPNRKTEETE